MHPALVALVEVLRRDDKDSRAIWDILTALRGPDYDQTLLKEATTGVIRYALFGPTAGRAGYGSMRALNGCVYGPDRASYVRTRMCMPLDHFRKHSRDAFRALGLRWDEVNPA